MASIADGSAFGGILAVGGLDVASSKEELLDSCSMCFDVAEDGLFTRQHGGAMESWLGMCPLDVFARNVTSSS